MSDTKPLLEAEMGVLQEWFDKVYGKNTPRRGELKIYYKQNMEKRREEYILDMFFDSTSRSLPFQVPFDALELVDMRLKIKERWVGEMQNQIIQTLG